MRSLLLLLWLLVAATAQEPGGPSFLIEGLEPGPPPPAASVDPMAYRIGKLLRCPVCQGLSIADSNAEGAVMIQNRIEEMVAAGYDQQQIQDYFVDKYGEWILLEPPPEGLNLLIWLGPAGALSIGLIGLLLNYRKSTQPVVTTATARTTVSNYEEQLLQELDDGR